MKTNLVICLAFLLALCACQQDNAESMSAQTHYDVLIRGGDVYDGSGQPARQVDIGIRGDRITKIGTFEHISATHVIDADGLAVAPGFINMLSWATETLLENGYAPSDIRQGVTLEVFGEGKSMGPLNAAMRADLIKAQGDIKFEVTWNTLDEYLKHLEERGVAPNVASFIGATTLRVHTLGYQDRKATPAELSAMQTLVREAMREGALGVGSSLIYAPAFYADTNELIALVSAAAEFGGSYISHLRSEGNQLLEGVDELISIARATGADAEIYHLKAAGQNNWGKLPQVFEQIEQARSAGLNIRANMYNYTAGATGLDAAMPPWVQAGGLSAWVKRLQDPKIRAQVLEEIRTPSDTWENLYLAAGSADRVILNAFVNDDLKPLTGKTLAEIAQLRGTTPEDTIIDLVIEDNSEVGAVYFLMSEDNVRQKIAQPWMSFGSDAGAYAPEGVFLASSPHPRAYGNFARLLGQYVRDQGVISLTEAVRRLSSLPAENLKLHQRGRLQTGYFADVVIFDPKKVNDPANYEQPHQYATGMQHVIINGEIVLRDAEFTGALPGRVVRGPGYQRQAGEG